MPKRIGLVLMLVLFVAGCGGDSKPEARGPFDYDRDASLEFKDKGRVNRNYPIEIRDVSYASPGGDDDVTAFLVKPPEAAPPDVRFDVAAILTEVDPLRHIREAAPAKLRFQNGRRDEVVPRAALLAMYRAASKPKEIRWYDATHEPTAAVYRDTLSWLTKELGLSTSPVVPRAKIGP